MTTALYLSLPLFSHPDLDHKHHARTQTNMAQASSPPLNCRTGSQSSGVRAKLATCVALGPLGRKGWTCDVG